MSQFNIDNIILNYFKNKNNGFFVEVGVCDPINQNNTFLLEKNGWKGVLIEPSTKHNSNYAVYRPNSIIENVAIVSKDYDKNYIFFNDSFNENGGFTSTVSEDTDTNNKVSCDTLENILLKNNVYSIDFLSIDVEGYEKQVMDGIDVKKFDIKTIVIETHDKNKLPFIQYESTFEDFEYLCDIYNKEIISEYHILFTKK